MQKLPAFVTLLAVVFGLMTRKSEGSPEFSAYYTKISKGESWEASSRTGKYADIVVQLPIGKLIYWRGASYLPYWQTTKGEWPLPEIIPRSGDGQQPMPDHWNVYSHVEIVSNTPSAAVVHWRYLSSFTGGNPHGKVELRNFVDETFTITPEGKVHRVVKQAKTNIDDWNDALNQTEEDLQLTEAGAAETRRILPRRLTSVETPAVNSRNAKLPVTPRLWFQFDERIGSKTREKITQTVVPIAGPKALWKKGISGTALEFDGYQSVVTLPPAKAPNIAGGNLSLEGWVALGAYPWNWAPIVQQGDNAGYFLGIDSHGYPGFMAEISGTWQQLSLPGLPPYSDTNHLALFHWYYIAGTYNKEDGLMRLFIDGKEIARKSAGTGGVQTINTEVRVGKAGILRTPTEGTNGTKPSDFGLDGLLDEVRIYDVTLSPAQLKSFYQETKASKGFARVPDMQRRQFPRFDTQGKFAAFHTYLPYYETWDNMWCAGKYSDVVVGFDESPVQWYFWRGASYIPMMVNEAHQWYTNEFDETGFKRDAPGDCEPMSDKPCLDSHVRIIENNGARILIHWRYRLANPNHQWAYYDKDGWGDIADWYLYIFPDGVTCKAMRCYSSKPEAWHEWDEQIIGLGEGQHPEEVIKKTPVMTLVDGASGRATDYNWNPNPPRPNYKGSIIQMIHLTGRYSPFSIQKFDSGDIYRGERTWYSVFPSWNHWPTSQIDSSGRNASFTDRAAHSSISHLFWPVYAQEKGEAGFEEKLLMEGMSDQPATALTSLAKSWLDAPSITEVSGGTSDGYNQEERSYGFEYSGKPLSFTINATANRPIQNLCFEIKHWTSRTALAGLEINGLQKAGGPDFRQGVNIDTDGTPTLIVWVGLSSTSAQNFRIGKK